jgi:hypothetical protein
VIKRRKKKEKSRNEFGFSKKRQNDFQRSRKSCDRFARK